MPKINIKNLKKSIKNNEISKVYYFTGEDFFLMKNFTDKIFEISNPEYKNGIDFISLDDENVDINFIQNFANTFSIFQKKKCILLSSSNMNNMKKDFYDDLIKIASEITELCTLIIQDTSIIEKKNPLYQKFISKICEISIFTEFKHESSSSQKQAMLWAKEFGKIISKENAKFLCEKCTNDLNSVKNLIENVCLNSNEKEISRSLIEELSPKIEMQHSIYEISKAIRSNDIPEAIRISEYLIDSGEDPLRILSVLSFDFIDALRVQEAEKEEISYSNIVKTFKYQGKEFKLKYASILSKKFDVLKIMKSLIKAEVNMKSSLMPKITVIRSIFIDLFENSNEIQH